MPEANRTRFAVSTVLSGATLVVTYGRFSMPPDLQYLVDATFDDSARTGRYRRGNPNLGFEQSNQFEFSLRLRPKPVNSTKEHMQMLARLQAGDAEGAVQVTRAHRERANRELIAIFERYKLAQM